MGTTISAFQHEHVPASFVESYSGHFDQIFATRDSGEVVGFVSAVGEGRVMMLGAALPATTLDDLDLVSQMARTMGCAPLFELSEWADVRASRGATGTFLFVSNYRDDPIATTVVYDGEPLFGGNPVRLPARRGLILPLGWHLAEGVQLHYSTGEVTAIQAEEGSLTLTVEPAEFVAELSLEGYRCEEAMMVDGAEGARRVQVRGTAGRIVLQKGGTTDDRRPTGTLWVRRPTTDDRQRIGTHWY